MERKIIHIDEDTCNGCGLCAAACHEGAIGMVDGKAKLLRDDYCDGLGDCLPACPTGAITFTVREAAPYDAAAVAAAKQTEPLPCGCPGTHANLLKRPAAPAPLRTASAQEQPDALVISELRQWPVQIKLVPVHAPYFHEADLLIAADCTAYAYADFHRHFLRGRIALIGCPKLDEGDYAEKLTAILRENEIRSVTIVRMQVPCCGGIEHAVKNALQACGNMIPWQVSVISPEGMLL